jgi:hypothetical protein
MELKEKKEINLFQDNIFNVDSEDTEKIPWNKLKIEERVEKINFFFNQEFNIYPSNHSPIEKNQTKSKKINKETVKTILNMVEEGKLILKKEILYDEMNKRISKILVLSKVPHTNFYIYKPKVLSQKEKSKKSAKHKLFRKK